MGRLQRLPLLLVLLPALLCTLLLHAAPMQMHSRSPTTATTVRHT